jgi:predicted transposase YbfD/YdcC
MPACSSSFIGSRRGQSRTGCKDGLLELWHVCSVLPDPRKRRGVRHSVASVVALSVAAVAAGSRSLSAIGAWAQDLPLTCRCGFGVDRAVPSVATFTRVLGGVDPDVLDAVLCAWISARRGPGGSVGPVAVDGKTARGARRPDGTRVHLFAAIGHDGIPVGQVIAPTKGFEIAAFRTLLDRADLHGRVVTADALHTQTAHAHYLHAHGAYYAFTVKANQPSLRKRLVALPWDQVPVAHVNVEAGHGRRERRDVQLITKVHPRLGFPHARLAAKITRSVVRTGARKATRESAYVISSLPEQTTAAQVAALVRGHWSIENRLHWVRDVTYDEDRSPVRTGTLPAVMATLRNVALGLLRTAGTHNIAAANAALARKPERVLTLIEPPRIILT